MGVDRTGNGTDDSAENVEKPPPKDAQWRPPPDRPGSPGQPSRLQSYRDSEAMRAALAAQREERADKQPQPAEDKPDQGEEETADRGTRGSSETESDDQLRDDRSVEDVEQEKQKDQPAAQTDEDEGAAAPRSEDPSGSERSERATEKDTDAELGDDSGTDTQPEPEGKQEKPSEQDVWEKFASQSAKYEIDGRQYGFRTWGEEFAARRESREAARQARENDAAESQDEPPVQTQAPDEEQKSATDAGTDRSDGKDLRPGDTAGTEAVEPGITDQDAAWREHADAMRAKWADLESEQPPDEPPEESDQGDDLHQEGTSEGSEDLSEDEPGSWRGDGGQYLNLEENYAVRRTFERVQDQETDVTDEVKTGEADVDDAKLVGLEFRLKGEERFKEKVAEQLAAELREDPTRVAEAIPDALRYTYQIPADKYTQGYGQITEKLADDGFEMVYSRNSWDTPVYKGVNTRWKAPGGQLFEVQFHTPESFEAKQLTHAAYERRRSPQVGELEAGKLDEFQREVSAGIPTPPNVSEIPSFRREE